MVDRKQRSGFSLFSRQLPLVDGADDLPLRRALGRRRDRRRQPRRPCAARQGRRRRCVVRRMDPHGRQDRGPGRAAEQRRPQAHRRLMLPAGDALLPDRRALPAAEVAARHGRLRQIREDVPRCRRDHPQPAHRARRNSLSRARACRRCWCIPIAKSPAIVRRRPWSISTASTSPRKSSTATRCPISRRAASVA